jgi:3-hydroxyisobutyrate dehydrogenase-like beta-hydroxyacid dehydrogenase
VLAIPFDGHQVRQVLLGPDGALDGLEPGGTVVVMSTIGARMVKDIARDVQARGFRVVDAPVTGGVQGAKAGELTIIASGSAEAMERARPVLQPMARVVHEVGAEPGDGQFVKLLNQLLVGVHIVASSEAVGMAAAAGIDLKKAYDVLCDGFGRSEVFAARVKSVLDQSLTTGGALSIFLKDLPLVQEAAGELGVPAFTLASAVQVFQLAERVLPAGADDAHLIDWARRVASGEVSDAPAV